MALHFNCFSFILSGQKSVDEAISFSEDDFLILGNSYSIPAVTATTTLKIDKC